MDQIIREKIWEIEKKLYESGAYREFLSDYYVTNDRLLEVAKTMTEEQIDAVFDYLNMFNRLSEIMLEIAVSQ